MQQNKFIIRRSAFLRSDRIFNTTYMPLDPGFRRDDELTLCRLECLTLAPARPQPVDL